MWRFISIFFLLISFNAVLSQSLIKSLQWGIGKNFEFPVLLSDHSKLRITFDIKSDEYPQFAIVFKFCDKYWTPYNSVFLQPDGRNIEYDLNYSRLPGSITGANYHYEGYFPNKNIEFPFSGRWKFFITSLYDTSDVFTWGEFFVIRQSTDIKVSARKMRDEDRISDNNIFDRVYYLTTEVKLKENQTWFDGIQIIENRKILNPLNIDVHEKTEKAFVEMKDINSFSFLWKDLHPGNEYRSIDIRDENKFPQLNDPQLFYHIEYSRLYEFGKNDLNGNFILKNFNNPFADYISVQINFREPDLDDDVYLVGAFNYWEILPEYKMKKDGDLYSITINLKRGKYDYQFITVPKNKGVEFADWYKLEGNFWETSNEYHIFVNYKSQDFGGYDKIIGYSKYMLNGNGKN